MLRTSTIGAFIAAAVLIGTQSARAQTAPPAGGGGAPDASDGTDTVMYGVFRENVPNLPDDQRNCWVQAMISGDTINAERLAERISKKKAQEALRRDAKRGLCANQRTSENWSARHDDHSD